MTNILERPKELENRLVPGHGEGDLILGAGASSAIARPPCCTTRFVVLVRMPMRKAGVAACAFAGALNAIPAPLRKTLTYDQGRKLRIIAAWLRIPACASSSPTRIRPSSAAQTRRRTGCCGNIFPQARRCRASTRSILTSSPPA